MARDVDNPDTRGKDMDMTDVRTRWTCDDCGEPVDRHGGHADGCPNGD